MTELSAGTRVRVHGLRARAELNGNVAVVLAPANAEEARLLGQRGRIKVTGYPTPRALRVENVEVLDEAACVTDWMSFVAAPPHPNLTMREVILMDERLGAHDVCDEFVHDVLRLLTPTPWRVPRRPFTRERSLDAILNNTSQHCIYLLHMDQVSHHMVVEAKEGRARVFQCFVRALVTGTDGSAETCGYTAREWASEEPQPGWSKGMRAAHARWGGGRELSRGELAEILEVLLALQEAVAPAIVRELSKQVPTAVLEAEQAHGEGDGFTPVQRWTAEALERPDATSIAPSADDGAVLFSNDAYRHEPFVMHVGRALHAEFSHAYRVVTGQEVMSTTYLRVLNHYRWQAMFERAGAAAGAAVGEPRPTGWGITAIALQDPRQ